MALDGFRLAIRAKAIPAYDFTRINRRATVSPIVGSPLRSAGFTKESGRAMARKGLWLALCLGVPASAHAFDLTPDTTRYLSDPAFLPLTGQVYGETSYGYRELSEDRIVPGIGVFPHAWIRDTIVGQELSYGISDRLSLNATLDFQESRLKDSLPFVGGAESYYARGFNNPIVGATYRAIEQGYSPVDLDISVSYSPDAFTAREATLSNGGTTASGGQAGGIQIAVSREMRSLTLQAYGAATYYGDQNRSVPTDNSTTTLGANWRYDFGLRGQIRPIDRFVIDAGAGVTGNTDLKVRNPAEQLAYTGSFDPAVTFFVAPGYHLIPNRLVLSAEYDRDYLGNETVTGTLGPVATWKNQVENVYAAHLRFLFF